MVERGHEFGTTTGRRRRCGWMDLVALRYAVRLNRMDALAITKLDVLQRDRPAAGRGPLPLQGGRGPRQLPLPPVDPALGHTRVRGAARLRRGHRAAAASEADLPPAARDYLGFIAEFVGVPIRLVGVGPDRDQVDLDRLLAAWPARLGEFGRRQGGDLPLAAFLDHRHEVVDAVGPW